MFDVGEWQRTSQGLSHLSAHPASYAWPGFYEQVSNILVMTVQTLQLVWTALRQWIRTQTCDYVQISGTISEV